MNYDEIRQAGDARLEILESKLQEWGANLVETYPNTNIYSWTTGYLNTLVRVRYSLQATLSYTKSIGVCSIGYSNSKNKTTIRMDSHQQALDLVENFNSTLFPGVAFCRADRIYSTHDLQTVANLKVTVGRQCLVAWGCPQFSRKVFERELIRVNQRLDCELKESQAALNIIFSYVP